jgi:hypothetical protein
MLFAFEALAPELLGAEAFGAEALGTALGAEALMGLGAEALGAGAVGGAEAALGADAMAANAAAGGAGAGGAGINAAQVAAQQNAAMQLANPGITGIPEAMSPAQQAYQAASSANSMQGITPGIQSLPAYPSDFQSVNQIANQVASTATPPPPVSPINTMGLEMPGAYTPPSNYPMGLDAQIPANQFIEAGSGGINSVENAMAQANVANIAPPSALEAGMDKALNFAKKYPGVAMTGAYMGANALGLLNPSGATFNNAPYSGPLSKYKLAPDFQGSFANPSNFQYTPKRYAGGGGIMGNESYDIPVGYDEGEMVQDNVPEYASGGSLSDSIAQYQKMLGGQQQAAPAASRDVGIYYDQDPDTRYQDALTAAQIRQAKVNQRAYVSAPVAKRPTPMGKLNMPTSAKSKDSSSGDVEAYRGGIMQSGMPKQTSLGGYAAGGNPRLLKGPGDGMSDNIPATINGRQPARLADGEFVVPADVVSHLGNGSTDAGAKQLHGMMDKVRKARTGNPKQGKNIKPQKYMPK